jgi:hypothetical protein
MGQSVRVTVEGDPDSYLGYIKRLSPTISEQNRVLSERTMMRQTFNRRWTWRFVKAEIVTNQMPRGDCATERDRDFAGIDKVTWLRMARRSRRR